MFKVNSADLLQTEDNFLWCQVLLLGGHTIMKVLR